MLLQTIKQYSKRSQPKATSLSRERHCVRTPTYQIRCSRPTSTPTYSHSQRSSLSTSLSSSSSLTTFHPRGSRSSSFQPLITHAHTHSSTKKNRGTLTGKPDPSAQGRPTPRGWHQPRARFCTERTKENLSPLPPNALTAMPAKGANCNVTEAIEVKVGRNLHRVAHHPLHILKTKVEEYFSMYHESHAGLIESPEKQRRIGAWGVYDSLPPYVRIQQNFDDLLIPSDHVSRSASDTYYINSEYLLRTHMSAHQTELLRTNRAARLLRAGHERDPFGFIFSGDVYRRDEIDATHYPIFHQCDAIKTFDNTDLEARTGTQDRAAHQRLILEDMKIALEGLVRHLFGEVQMRWVEAYFPFTDPSLELEIFFNDQWLEVLGSGVMQQAILDSTGETDKKGWAFGLGLERLAMVLFHIPDIRLFWSEDPRFVEQFKNGQFKKFVPFSKYPPCIKDLSFWVLDEAKFHQNDLFDLIRSEAGDMVEAVSHMSSFRHPKTDRLSHHFQINFRSMDRNLTNDEINVLQFKIRDAASSRLNIELR